MPPETTVAGPLLRSDRFALASTAVSAVLWLSSGCGSVTPPGGAMRAVLLSVAASSGAVAVIVIVALAPAGKAASVPATLVSNAPHTAPPFPLQLTVASLRPAGSGSSTVAPSAALGPSLLATSV